MIWFALGVIVGAFLGWNLPQPQFAKDIQNRITK